MQEADYRKSVGRRLLEVRKDAGHLQPEMAKLLQVSESAYKNYERGERELPLWVAFEVCESFNISPAWLVMGKGPKTLEEQDLCIVEAVIAVLSFAKSKKIEMDPLRAGKLVALLIQLFGDSDRKHASLIQNVLENAT